MDISLLREHRCTCGKLLFKGSVFLSTVEIKCKRCSKLHLFKNVVIPDYEDLQKPISFAFSIDPDGTIIDLCRLSESLLGYSKTELVGTNISKVCPIINDQKVFLKMSTDANKSYFIKSNVLILKDGNKISAESYCIADDTHENLEYKMINVIGLK